MREKGQTEVAKTLEIPVFSRGIEILTEKKEFAAKNLKPALDSNGNECYITYRTYETDRGCDGNLPASLFCEECSEKEGVCFRNFGGTVSGKAAFRSEF